MPHRPTRPARLLSRALASALLPCALGACDREAPPPVTRTLRAPDLASAVHAASARPEAGADACSFDWVSLDEALRSCVVLAAPEKTSEPRRRLRVSPSPLRVASGETLVFSAGVGQAEPGKGPWTLELDDRCGTAMRPMLVDDAQRLLDDLALVPPPACPSTRARVTLSGRGEVTARLSVKAVRRTVERVVVGHRTLPGGRVEDLVEMREKEVPLKPGSYGIEIALPTSDGASEIVPLVVTAPTPAPRASGGRGP